MKKVRCVAIIALAVLLGMVIVKDFVLALLLVLKGYLGTDALVNTNLQTVEIIITAISALGTIFLGCVANKQNDRLHKLEKQSTDVRNSSTMILGNCEADKNLSNEIDKEATNRKINIKFTNYSDAPLKEVYMYFTTKNKPDFFSPLVLPKGENKRFYIQIPNNYIVGDKVMVKFVSCYNVNTLADFEIYVDEEWKNRIRYYHFNGLEGETK